MRKRNWFTYFFDLIFPVLCKACENELIQGEHQLCSKCMLELPKTYSHLEYNYQIAKRFMGKVPIDHVWAYLYFRKKSISSKLIHLVKYNDDQELGIALGKWFGHDLFVSKMYKQYDVIVPVPLHPKRLKERGFNQSERIAEGIAEATQIPLITDAIQRKIYSVTQTRADRKHRSENVDHVFEIVKPELLRDKRVLIIDDILTTGATIESIAVPLRKYTHRIGVAVLGAAI